MTKESLKIGIVKMPKGKQFTFPLDLLFITDIPSYYYRVLFWVSQYPEYVRDLSGLASSSSCSIQEADVALHFWVENCIIEIMDDPLDEVEILDNDLELEDDDLNTTTVSVDMAMFVQGRKDIRDLIEVLDPLFEEEFGDAEIGILIEMIDYLNVSPQYIITLIRHCISMDIHSFREFKKRAVKNVKNDITTEEELQAQVKLEKALFDFTNEIKLMFNASYRALTSSELRMIESWHRYGYGLEAVRKAYEESIKYTKKPLIQYANKIIERWHSIGAHSLSEIERSYTIGASAFDKWKNKNNSSFDENDFFEAALKKSIADIQSKNNN